MATPPWDGTQDEVDMPASLPLDPDSPHWPPQPLLGRQGLWRSRFPLLAPVTAWKRMIHVQGRLRLSNKVVVCFPLQNLCIFILAAAAAAGPGEVTLAEAREAQREEAGSDGRAGLGRAASGPSSFQDISMHILS